MRAKHARRQYRPPSRAATKTLGRCLRQKEGPAVPNFPPIPLLKPLTSARLPVSGVRQASASTCDSESSEAKKQAAGQSLSLKSSIAAPVITSIVDTCLSHRGHKTQQWMTDTCSRGANINGFDITVVPSLVKNTNGSGAGAGRRSCDGILYIYSPSSGLACVHSGHL